MEILMNTFFTSDHHFCHANIIRFEPLNRIDAHGVMFENVEQMDECLIERWNEVVGVDDLVYHLGNMSYKRETLRAVLPRLNGRKILICGNHDPYFERMVSGDPAKIKLAEQRAKEDGFESIHAELEIEVEGIGRVKLNHYPYAPLKEGDELFAKYLNLRPKPTGEALLLHGHVHSQWFSKQHGNNKRLMINVGVDTWRLRPLSAEDLQGVLRAYEH